MEKVLILNWYINTSSPYIYKLINLLIKKQHKKVIWLFKELYAIFYCLYFG